jgi:hypothetical protein
MVRILERLMMARSFSSRSIARQSSGGATKAAPCHFNMLHNLPKLNEMQGGYGRFCQNLECFDVS